MGIKSTMRTPPTSTVPPRLHDNAINTLCLSFVLSGKADVPVSKARKQIQEAIKHFEKAEHVNKAVIINNKS